MIVNWKKNNLNVVPIMKKEKDKKAVVSKTITLMPGINKIDEILISDLKRSLKKDIEDGNVEFVMIEKDGKQEVATSLKEMKPKQAQKIIAETNDLNTLKKLKEGESRDEIRAEIKDREEEIEDYIKNPKKKKGKK